MTLQLETIQRINSLKPNELKDFVNKLTKGKIASEAEKLELQINRILMPYPLTMLFIPKRYKFYHGGRGGAKSVSFSKALLKKANEKRIRVLCCREIQDSIKDSVHSSLKDLIYQLKYKNYKVTDNMIVNKATRSEFIFIGLYKQGIKQSIKSYSNIDIAWVEEAQSVSDASIKILTPTIRKKNSEIWFSFNRLLPDDPVWKFQQRQPEEKKIVEHVNYEDNLFLTEELQDEALISKKEFEEGVNEDYPHIWLGEPAQYSDRTVLKYNDVIKAINRDIKAEGGVVIGVDVARFGKDRTVFFKRKGLKIIDWKMYPKTSVDEVVSLLVEFTGRNNTHIPIRVDDTGIGGGVTDFMMKYGYNVIPVNFGQRAQDSEKYNNAISEMWFHFRSIINEVSIPDIQELKNELLTREYGFDNKERRKIQSKDEYKKKYGKSPDFADALLLCYYNITGESGYFIDGVI